MTVPWIEIFMSHFALNSSEHLLASMATFRDFLIASLQPSSLKNSTKFKVGIIFQPKHHFNLKRDSWK